VKRLPPLLLALVALAAGADCPGPARLEEALALLAQANPVPIAERDTYTEQTRQHAWETVVTLGYSVTDTFEAGAAGPNAALRVRIPLWDRSTDLKTARARSAWQRAADTLRTAFLADIQALCEQAAQVQALATLHAFHRDRLAYRQEQVDQGLAEADALWSEAEGAQKAEHDWQREAGKLAAKRLTLARRYGGEEWGRLQVLLEAMAR
jgi:hypothetical protein